MSIAISRLRGRSRDFFCKGALHLGLLTGFVAYWNYRFAIKKEFILSAGHYRFASPITNMTPFESIWLQWYRMPQPEFNIHHKFIPYYIIGQLDYTKEVLLPKKRYIDGKWQEGFDVINPLYCYDAGRFNMEHSGTKDMLRAERAAFIVHRGWIPYEMKDRASRPWETNSNQLVKLHGVFMPAPDIHNYKVANNPNNNEWHNLALEDIARYWDLPNFNELKHYYFQTVDLHNMGGMTVNNGSTVYKWPHVLTKDETIREHHKWMTHESYNRLICYSLGSVSLVSWAFFLLSV